MHSEAGIIRAPALEQADEITPVPWLDQFVLDLVQEVQGQSVSGKVIADTTPEEIDRVLPEIPDSGLPAEHLRGHLEQLYPKFSKKNAHPGVFSYILAPGLPIDPAAHALVAAMNQSVVGFHASPLAEQLEKKVIRFFSDKARMPETAGGLMMSGGSGANLTALVTALHHSFDGSFKDDGLFSGKKQPVIICSESAHFSIDRAVMMMGVGLKNLVKIPVDEQLRMDVDSLSDSLEDLARSNNKQVVCVVGTAGNTASGAVDPLDKIASVCQKHDIWFHVDAAYGGAAILSDKLRQELNGIELADSLTIDLHKWYYQALEASMLIFGNQDKVREVFSVSTDYIQLVNKQEKTTSYDLSYEVSRRFRALPVYLGLLHYGVDVIAKNLEFNIACAAYLEDLVSEQGDLEIVTRRNLTTCCFRYVSDGLSVNETDWINTMIVERLNSSGEFLLSETVVRNRPVLRICIRGYTTRATHVLRLVEKVCELGETLLPPVACR